MAPNNSTLERPKGSALVDTKRSPVDGLITNAQDLVQQVEKARQQFHVIAPVVSTSQLAPGYAAAFSVVAIDLSPNSPDIYKDKMMREDEVALTKISLMRICAAIGISWTKTERLDNGSKRNYWNVRVEGEYHAADGTLQKIGASKEVDLTDDSPQAKAMTTAQIGMARVHGQQLAETKAQLRAVRNFGIVAKYTRAQLAKPFLVVRFSFVPDMHDPDIKRMVTAAKMGITHLLYPASTAPEATAELPAELGGRSQPEPKQVGAGRTAPAPAAPQPTEAEFDDDSAEDVIESDDRPRHRVDSVKAKNAAGDFAVILGDGNVLLTADEAVARVANSAKKAGHAVIVTASNGRIDELVALTESAPTTLGANGQAGGEPVDDGLRNVEKVDSYTGSSPDKKDPTKKKAWTKFTVVLSTGESFVTFSQSFADIANEAKAKGWKVRVAGEQSERYPDQTDLTAIELIDPRQGTLLGGADKY